MSHLAKDILYELDDVDAICCECGDPIDGDWDNRCLTCHRIWIQESAEIRGNLLLEKEYTGTLKGDTESVALGGD